MCLLSLPAGIYDQTKDRIIAYTVLEAADTTVPTESEEGASLGEIGRRIVIDLVALSKTFSEYSIVYEKVSSFTENNKLMVYQYGVEDDDGKEPTDGTNPTEDINGCKAADYARFFIQNGNGRWFGPYCFSDWNCENFATFCKTATVSLEDLSKAATFTRGSEEVDGRPLSREFLIRNSSTTSMQSRRYLKQGVFLKKLR